MIAIERLVAKGLIEWSPEEELVRVVGAHRQRPPENVSQAIGFIRDFISLLDAVDHESEGVVLRALAEFVVASIKRGRNWKPEKGEFGKLRDVLGDFLRRAYQEFADDLLEALHSEMANSSKAAKSELGSLLPPILLYPQDTVSTPSPHPADTRDVDDTRQRQDLDKDQEKNKEETLGEFVELGEPALSEAAKSDQLRKGETPACGSQSLPKEVTKRSALVKGLRG